MIQCLELHTPNAEGTVGSLVGELRSRVPQDGTKKKDYVLEKHFSLQEWWAERMFQGQVRGQKGSNCQVLASGSTGGHMSSVTFSNILLIVSFFYLFFTLPTHTKRTYLVPATKFFPHYSSISWCFVMFWPCTHWSFCWPLLPNFSIWPMLLT